MSRCHNCDQSLDQEWKICPFCGESPQQKRQEPSPDRQSSNQSPDADRDKLEHRSGPQEDSQRHGDDRRQQTGSNPRHSRQPRSSDSSDIRGSPDATSSSHEDRSTSYPNETESSSVNYSNPESTAGNRAGSTKQSSNTDQNQPSSSSTDQHVTSSESRAPVAEGTTSTQSPAKNTPGADEQFCHSCGAVIKIKAEVCPECGVQVAKEDVDSDMPEMRKMELRKKARANLSTVTIMSFLITPVGYVMVDEWGWALINVLTGNYALLGFIIVPFHTRKMIKEARNELNMKGIKW